MKISKIAIKNYLGIDELQITPSEINVFRGPNGSGKTSILEAIENGFNSKPKRRTEVIKHNADEATLFIETDNGIEIDRKLRKSKSDYLKVKSGDPSIKSTESQLKQLFSGSIFRPLDFIDWKPQQQTDAILNTIDIPFSKEKFIEWFGTDKVLSNINIDKHVLMILKNIETNHYNTRQDVNREIATLKHQAEGIKKEMPDNYNGADWENVDLKELYQKVSDAEKVNGYIEKGQLAIEEHQQKIDSIDAAHDNRVDSVKIKYRELASDISDIIDLAKGKISKAEDVVFNSKTVIDNKMAELDNELESKIIELRQQYDKKKELAKKEILDSIDDQKDIITLQEKKIASKESELAGLGEKEQLELNAIQTSRESELSKLDSLTDKWKDYLDENEVVDIAPLKADAENAEFMKSHLREWDRYQNIMEVQVAEKQRYSNELTSIIETARQLPSTLLQLHELPIDGISVDEKGMIRINGTLLDGLSDGEKLDTGLRIAHYQMGELRIMCLDRFEQLDPMNQEKVIDFCEKNDIQAFITIPDKEFSYENHL